MQNEEEVDNNGNEKTAIKLLNICTLAVYFCVSALIMFNMSDQGFFATN